MRFFSQFPKIQYDLKNDNVLSDIINIYRHVDVNENVIDGFLNYKFERIEDGERPDQMAFRLYDNSSFYWTFFIVNDFLKEGYTAWPKGQIILNEFIEDNYDPYSVLAVDAATLQIICSLPTPLSQTITIGNNEGIEIYKIDETRQQIWLKGSYSILDNVENEAFKITGHEGSPLVLTAIDGWASAANAPMTYNIFDSATGDIMLTTDFVSYKRHLEDEDEQRSLIKIIRPGLLSTFIDTYKELINE